MIPASHFDSLVEYLTEHGLQTVPQIREGMREEHPSVNLTRYMLQKLCSEGRLQQIGPDSYRATLYKTESEVAS